MVYLCPGKEIYINLPDVINRAKYLIISEADNIPDIYKWAKILIESEVDKFPDKYKWGNNT